MGFALATENGIRPKSTPNDESDLPFAFCILLIKNKVRFHLHSREVN